MSTPTKNILPDLSDLAVKKPRVDDLPDSLVQGILKNESGGQHYSAPGKVKMGPPTRSGSRAIGKWQVMPDAPGGRTRTIGGQTFDLYDEAQNDAAGRAYLKEGYDKAGGDERGRHSTTSAARARSATSKRQAVCRRARTATRLSRLMSRTRPARGRHPRRPCPTFLTSQRNPRRRHNCPTCQTWPFSPPAPTLPDAPSKAVGTLPTTPAGLPTPAIQAAAPQPKVTSRVLTPEEEEAVLNPPVAAPNLQPYDPDKGLSAPAPTRAGGAEDDGETAGPRRGHP
jgi:hypothetical protein